ncbi:SDR family NAD(P)-dependent oxidoreductase [Kribbella sandramycini]|uniref:3-hydroxybutyrate dehydrogenase n=1 Tax=Kribbella sandramycini TaxID=60450 RepID=A0A7Y4P0N7_9ACTN|nr:SDR family NAD(P)-dependent oxidoreductase [Kribbella sandramycini]MBB6571242.1 3-hydroxybutyrate dehydrogenase [Kribbella sandramycini]NOL43352.1 SDR family NAD(P)-dependent oxidoreductase [Kribbella sandramycini]
MEPRRALVTGAASGIGAACVERLVKDGFHVLAVDREPVPESAGVQPLLADLSELDALGELPTDIDVLVNNAGVQTVAPVEEFPPERFSYLVRLMLEAPFRLIRQSLPHMYATGWGRVVNISSVHGLRASPFKAAYVAAKHGLEGLSKVVALEGAARGVTSNCVTPAYVRTPLVTAQLADQATAHGLSESEVLNNVMLEPVAVKRLIEPAEVAELVALLCGPASASITGSSFVLDGGWTAH